MKYKYHKNIVSLIFDYVKSDAKKFDIDIMPYLNQREKEFKDHVEGYKGLSLKEGLVLPATIKQFYIDLFSVKYIKQLDDIWAALHYPNQYIQEGKTDKTPEYIEQCRIRDKAKLILIGAIIASEITEDSIKEWIEIHNSKPEKNTKDKAKPKTSFVWPNNQDKELPELYRLMHDRCNLIAPNITYEQFKAVFTGQPIDENFEPVRWISSNRLLAYFLDSVFIGQDWQSIAANGDFFLNKKGNSFSANDLAQAKKGFKDFGKPKGYEMIDKILSDIKKIHNIKTS